MEQMCRLAGVPRSGYYRHWREHKPLQEETAVRDRIQALALKQRRYGYRRITAALQRDGFHINRKRVLRIMREDNLLCLRKKSFVPTTTQSNHRYRVWPNLARRLTPMATDQLWVGDITYIRLDEGFVYLAVILDAFSRKVIRDHMKTELTLEALDMALATRDVTPGLVHHTDQGVQYACTAYIEKLQSHGIQPSQSRPGCPYDNAMAESFMKTLKQEEIYASQYRDIDHLSSAMTEFIETVYNKTRLHSALGYRPPEEYEALTVTTNPAKFKPAA